MNSEPNHGLIRFAGLIGLGGAVLFFVGDMLFYGHLGSGDHFRTGMIETVKGASLARLYVGGLIGPFAALMCMVGFWHVWKNIEATNLVAGYIVFFCSIAAMVIGSAVHALWVSKALIIKFAATNDWASTELGASVRDYWTTAFTLDEIFGLIGALVLLALVLLGKTNYPRWTVVASPVLTLLIASMAVRVPAPFGSILVGGSTNLAMTIFFAVCVTTTWKRPVWPARDRFEPAQTVQDQE